MSLSSHRPKSLWTHPIARFLEPCEARDAQQQQQQHVDRRDCCGADSVCIQPPRSIYFLRRRRRGNLDTRISFSNQGTGRRRWRVERFWIQARAPASRQASIHPSYPSSPIEICASTRSGSRDTAGVMRMLWCQDSGGGHVRCIYGHEVLGWMGGDVSGGRLVCGGGGE